MLCAGEEADIKHFQEHHFSGTSSLLFRIYEWWTRIIKTRSTIIAWSIESHVLRPYDTFPPRAIQKPSNVVARRLGKLKLKLKLVYSSFTPTLAHSFFLYLGFRYNAEERQNTLSVHSFVLYSSRHSVSRLVLWMAGVGSEMGLLQIPMAY